jgi:hypothetical protein
MYRSVLVAFILLSFGCGPKAAERPPPMSQPLPPASEPAPAGGEAGAAATCSVDADCVPASCCHPNSCVPAAQKPDCSGQMCTMECRADTLDCGGRCACEAGSCTAVLAKP